MPNRTAKFASAIVAGFFAGAPLAAIPDSMARAADNCLSGPKHETPPGGHWYYRIDRVTKRHCWYVGDEREKVSRLAPSNLPPSAKPFVPNSEAAMQRSTADAHAEFTVPAPGERSNRGETPLQALPADAAIVRQNGGIPRTAAVEMQRSIVASRWPDPVSTSPSAVAIANGDSPVTPVNSTPRTPPAPAVAAVRYAAADVSSGTRAYSGQMQLGALVAALALAGIIGGGIFKFGLPGRTGPGKVRRRRGAHWDATDDDSIVLSAYPGTEALFRQTRGTGFARNADRNADPGERIAEFFSQISRRAPS